MTPIVVSNQDRFSKPIAVRETSARATHDFLPETYIAALRPLVLIGIEMLFVASEVHG